MVKNIEKKNKIEQNPSKATDPSIKKKYKGVRMRSWGSWVSEIRAPNQKTRIWLGSYSTAEAAARAYDAALLCLKGSSANLNFPLSTTSSSLPSSSSSNSYQNDIPHDVVLSPKSIQRVAAAAANATTNTNTNTNTTIAATTTFVNDNNALAIANDLPSSSSSSSPSSSSSSSSAVSSPSDQVDDDVSLMGSLDHGAHVMSTTEHSYDHHHQQQSMAMMESWYNFDALQDYSPKYVDHHQMLFANGGITSGLFDPQILMEDPYEESDIRLWSFC